MDKEYECNCDGMGQQGVNDKCSWLNSFNVIYEFCYDIVWWFLVTQ